MSTVVDIAPSRTNGAHLAMWTIGAILLVGGIVLGVVGFTIATDPGTSNPERLAQGGLALTVGSSVASFGLLLTLIAWTIAAAKR